MAWETRFGDTRVLGIILRILRVIIESNIESALVGRHSELKPHWMSKHVSLGNRTMVPNPDFISPKIDVHIDS